MGLLNNPRLRWRWYPLVQLAIFQAGWWVIVLGAAHGRPWLGPLYVGVASVLHLTMMRSFRAELLLLIAAGSIGFAIDSTLAAVGALGFTGGSSLAPAWMIALWVLFASVLRTSCSWLLPHALLGAILGAVSGPIAYAGGVALGALTIPHGALFGYIGIAIAWAIAMPVLITIANTVDRFAAPTGVPRHA